MSKFQVDQRVQCTYKRKFGTVTNIDGSVYPVTVEFDDGDWSSYTIEGGYMLNGDTVLFPIEDEQQNITPSSRQEEEKAWLEVVSELIVKGMSAEYAVRQADTMIAEYRKRFGQEGERQPQPKG